MASLLQSLLQHKLEEAPARTPKDTSGYLLSKKCQDYHQHHRHLVDLGQSRRRGRKEGFPGGMGHADMPTMLDVDL